MLPEGLTRETIEALRERPELLVSICVQQAELIVQLGQRLAELEKRIQELEGQNRPPPPAAPFRRAEKHKVAQPKRPGRPPGHAPAWRQRPEQVDEDFEVPLAEQCPLCGSGLLERRALEQWIVDVPVVRPHVTHLRTWQAWCPRCRQPVRSTHPRQVSGAGGVAGVHLGARAQAVACALKHQVGLSLRKTTTVLRELCGLPVTPGAVAQIFQRVATRLQPRYEALAATLRAGAVVHTDETSWWVGGPKASLWVFCEKQTTFYRVVESRSRETFYEVIPADWPGVLVSDCLAVYDGATAHQHKCYSHHLKAISAAAEPAADPLAPESFLGRCRSLLLQAMDFKQHLSTMPATEQLERRRAFDLAARVLLDEPRLDRPTEERVRLRLRKQLDHLFTFLDHDAVEATNNLAERQLRPAVIARKLSCGQKTRAGADAWQVLASLAATCQQRAQSFIELVTAAVAFEGG